MKDFMIREIRGALFWTAHVLSLLALFFLRVLLRISMLGAVLYFCVSGCRDFARDSFARFSANASQPQNPAPSRFESKPPVDSFREPGYEKNAGPSLSSRINSMRSAVNGAVYDLQRWIRKR